MRDRLSAMSGYKKSRRVATGAICLLVSLGICFSDFARLIDPMSAAAVAPVQLVRLNFSADGGLVRIEITADGSFNDLGIQQFTRGRESIIRIVGARSMLRASYAINDELAPGVRTVAGERDGEPYVDLIITMGNGATIAQKKNFNRLVIGIASDFARLRRRSTPSTATAASEVARKSVHSTEATRPESISSAPVTDAIPTTVASNSYAGPSAAATTPPPVTQQIQPLLAAPSSPPPPVASATFPTLPVFRARTIWNDFPVAMRPFAPRLNISGISRFRRTSHAALNVPQEPALNFVPGKLEAPGMTPGVWVPGTTVARRDEVGGRPFGAGLLRPSFSLGAEFNDNYFYRSATGQNLWVLTFAPKIEYEIPGEERGMRFVYEPRVRRLTNGRWANGHFLDFDTRLRLSPSFVLAFRDHFARSPLDPREYDPAGETYIVGDTFTRNDGALRGEYTLTPRGRLAFDLGYNLVRWDENRIANAPLFLNYDELSSAVSYERDVSEETTTTATFSFSTTNTTVPLRPQFDGLNDRQSFALELGARTQMSETAVFAFRAGFERSLFRHAPSVNNYSGFVFNMLFRRDFSEKMNFEAAALRKTQVSAFNLEGGNARLVTTGGSLRLERKETEAFKLGFGLNYQRLDFPVAVVANSTASGGVPVGAFAGEQRRDNLFGFSVDATYQRGELLRTRLVYSFSRRDSSLPVLTFNRNRLSLIFEFGRRNDVRGRPF
jgi:hypothetical protein